MKTIARLLLILAIMMPGILKAQATRGEILGYRSGVPQTSPGVTTQWWNGSTFVGNYVINVADTTSGTVAWEAAAMNAALTYASAQGWTGITSANITFAFPTSNLIPTAPTAPTVSLESRSIVTGTGATGFQVSSTRYSEVSYTVQIVSTATIAGNALGSVVLEICPTNSATAGDWVEMARVTNGQALSLAVALQSVQTTAAPITAKVPAGYYVKIRSITTSGSPTFSYVNGHKAIWNF